MSFLRNVLRDLVEKRLWPVALLLVGALVAVPVVLGRSSDGGNTSAATAAVPATAASVGDPAGSRADAVSLEQDATGTITRGGKTRDPFVQHHLPKAATVGQTTTTTTPTSTTPAGGSTPGGAVTPSPSTPAPVNPGPSAPKPVGSSKATYRVSLTFGEDGAMKTYNNIARLTPLPSADNPFFVFLGVKDGGKSAVFLVDSSAAPSGDGKCEPSDSECQQIVLHKNDLEFFALQSGTAGLVQYQMEIKDISKGKAATTASAAAAHARESQAGRDYIRQILADDPNALADWSYNSKLGLLVDRAPEVANVPRAVASAAAGEPVQNTSTVLTVPAAPAQ